MPYWTVTGAVAACDSETVKLSLAMPEFPSTRVASDTDRLGRAGAATSSLVIVPMPEPSAIVAPLAPERFSVSVSFASMAVSPDTFTETVFDVWPAAKVSVPDFAA